MAQIQADPLAGRILTIRGQRVILDADLARLYGTTTKAFNQAFKRNAARFPKDFAFQLTNEEFEALRSQIVTTSGGSPEETKGNRSQIVTGSKTRQRCATDLRSQIVTSSSRHGGVRKRPWAFTEHGAVMAANVLRSPQATAMSVYVVRAFVRMKEELMTSTVILKRLAEIDRTLLEHDTALQILWKKLQPLLAPPPEPPKRKIGFHPGSH